MLESVSEAIRSCYQHAENCRRRAMELEDPAAKESFIEMERRWLDLARSYEFTERLSRFNNANRTKRPSTRE